MTSHFAEALLGTIQPDRVVHPHSRAYAARSCSISSLQSRPVAPVRAAASWSAKLASSRYSSISQLRRMHLERGPTRSASSPSSALDKFCLSLPTQQGAIMNDARLRIAAAWAWSLALPHACIASATSKSPTKSSTLPATTVTLASPASEARCRAKFVACTFRSSSVNEHCGSSAARAKPKFPDPQQKSTMRRHVPLTIASRITRNDSICQRLRCPRSASTWPLRTGSTDGGSALQFIRSSVANPHNPRTGFATDGKSRLHSWSTRAVRSAPCRLRWRALCSIKRSASRASAHALRCGAALAATETRRQRRGASVNGLFTHSTENNR